VPQHYTDPSLTLDNVPLSAVNQSFESVEVPGVYDPAQIRAFRAFSSKELLGDLFDHRDQFLSDLKV
jgi:hypothetical protein